MIIINIHTALQHSAGLFKIGYLNCSSSKTYGLLVKPTGGKTANFSRQRCAPNLILLHQSHAAEINTQPQAAGIPHGGGHSPVLDNGTSQRHQGA